MRVDPFYVGFYTCRVAVMEVLCTGADVIAVSATIACELYPYGEKIINGVRECLSEIDIDTSILIGSTEENMRTSMTAIGVTVTGMCVMMILK